MLLWLAANRYLVGAVTNPTIFDMVAVYNLDGGYANHFVGVHKIDCHPNAVAFYLLACFDFGYCYQFAHFDLLKSLLLLITVHRCPIFCWGLDEKKTKKPKNL